MLRRDWSRWIGFSCFLLLAALAVISVGAFFDFWVLPLSEVYFVEAGATLQTLSELPATGTVLKYIGAILTIITTTVGLVRHWHFMDRQLPERLNDYIEKCRLSTFENREALLVEAQQATSMPLDTGSWWSKRERYYRRREINELLRGLDGSATEPDGDMAELDRRMTVVSSAKQQVELDMAALHHARAAIFAKASDMNIKPELSRAKSIAEYRSAIKFDKDNDRLHQEYIEQLERSGNQQELTDAITAWVAACGRTRRTREEGRARSKLGDALAKHSEEPTLGVTERARIMRNARLEYEQSIARLINHPPTQGEFDFVLAATIERLADLRISDGALRPGLRQLQSLHRIYEAAGFSSSALRISERIEAINRDLQAPN